MGKNINKLIVVDVEATCWEGDPPKGQKSEIIEIGISQIDLKTLHLFGPPENILIKPVCSTVSEFCTKLTGLTQQNADGGKSLYDICSYIKNKYKSVHQPWASWGDYERNMFDRECPKEHYPFGSRHLNLKSLFSMLFGLPHELGMDKALSHLNIQLTGEHHRAGDDANNIARLAIEMFKLGRKS